MNTTFRPPRLCSDKGFIATKTSCLTLCAIAILLNIPSVVLSQEAGLQSLEDQRGSLLDLFEQESVNELEDPSPIDPNYTLAPGDVISIFIRHILEGGTPESGDSLRRERAFLIPPGGDIHLPLIGNIHVQDLTLNEASELISQRYAFYVRDPDVTLRLITPRPLNIIVSGEVYRPGSHVIPIIVDEGEPLPRVTQALKVAGGITTLADLRNVEVRRQVKGQPEVIPIDLWALLQGMPENQDILLRDGDTILVPKVEAVNQEEIRQIGKASFSPDLIQVYVGGEVDTPGLLEVVPNTTMNQALLASGGFLRSARTSSVELVRINTDSTSESRRIRVDLEAGANEENNPVLRHGDAILVRRSSRLKLVNFFGGVLEALLGTARIFRDTTLTILDLDEQ